MNTQGKVIPKFLSPYLDRVENIFFLGRLKSFWQRLIVAADIQPHEKIIDIGCGSGALTLLVAENLDGGGEIIGLDASKPLIERCQNQNNPKNVKFVQGIMENIPFPDQSFDVVLSSLAIHHVPKRAKVKAFGEFKRVLKKGGRLLVLDHGQPYYWWLKVLLFPMRWNLLEYQAENFRGEIPGMIAQVFGNVKEVDRFFGWIRIWKVVRNG